MDAITAIMTRRSIRAYRPGPVPEAALDAALQAAMAAPSAGDCRPWHFIVVRDKALLAAVPDIHPYARMAPSADAAVLVCAEPGLEKYKGFWVQDCAACVQNLLLALHAQGLGAVWTGVYPDQARVAGFRGLLGVPDQVVPFAFVPVGLPAQEAREADRFLPGRIHKDKW